MIECDPVVGGIGIGVGSAAVAYGTVELGGAMLVEEAVAWQRWGTFGWRTGQGMAMRFTANSVGQGVGNYIVSGNAVESVNNINWISSGLSAANIPLMASSIGSAAFKYDFDNGFRSVADGKVPLSQAAQDAALKYSFGQATRLSGFDELHRSGAAARLTNQVRYQSQLRLSPRFATGVSEAVPTVLGTTNRTASSAIRKVGELEVKKHILK